MRLHAIEIEAFGPFAEPVQLDLESCNGCALCIEHWLSFFRNCHS